MYETSAKKKVHSQTMEHKIERQSRFGFQLRNPPIFFEPPISRCLSSRTPPLRGPDNCFHQRGPYRQLQSDWLFFLVLCYMPTCSISWRVCVSAYVPGRRSSRARNENSETFPWAHQVEPEHSPPPWFCWGSAHSHRFLEIVPKCWDSKTSGRSHSHFFLGRFFGNNNFPGEYA